MRTFDDPEAILRIRRPAPGRVRSALVVEGLRDQAAAERIAASLRKVPVE